MNWHLYLYLIPVAALAGVLLVGLSRSYAELTTPSEVATKDELLFLAYALMLGIVAIYGNYFIGTQSYAFHDVGSDTLEQYVPYYINLLNSIRDGSLGLWNFQYGLGSSFMSYQSWTLDPFNLVLIPLGLAFGNQSLSTILVFIQSLKLLTCGFLFDTILCRYCKLPLSRILGSCIFAFCGYLILWGQHYWLGTVTVMAAVMTFLIEKMLAKWTIRGFAGMTVATAATIMMSTYSGFMVMLYAATYAILRTASEQSDPGIGGFFRKFIPMALPVVSGLLISCITVVPYATLLLGESSRVTVSSDVSMASKVLGYLTCFVPLRWIPAILSRLLGNGLFCINSDIPTTLVPTTTSFDSVNTYEFIQLGFSCCSLVLLGQFASWAKQRASKKDKVLICVGALLCVLYCFNFFLPALSNVFVNPKYRSAFALAFPICIAMAVGFEKQIVTGQIAKVNLTVCSAASIAILVWSMASSIDGKSDSTFSILALGAFVAFALVANNGKKPEIFVPLACSALLVSQLFDGFLVTNARGWATQDTFPGTAQSVSANETQEALSWIHSQNEGLYRVEKLYSDWTRLNDSLVEGYSGIASYNSTLDSDVIDYYNHLWPNMLVGDSAYQEYISDPDQPALLRMLGVKYLLAHDDLEFPWVAEVNRIGNTRIYAVQDSYGLLNVKSGCLRESDMELLDNTGRVASLSTCSIVPDEVYAAVSASAGNGDYTSGDAYTIEGSYGMQIPWDPAPSFLTLDKKGEITGSFHALSDGSVACLAIPHTLGWKVCVDGAEVETFRVNYGFIGFTVPAGDHTITAHFEASNLSVACVLTGTGVILGIVTCTIIAQKNK